MVQFLLRGYNRLNYGLNPDGSKMEEGFSRESLHRIARTASFDRTEQHNEKQEKWLIGGSAAFSVGAGVLFGSVVCLPAGIAVGLGAAVVMGLGHFDAKRVQSRFDTRLRSLTFEALRSMDEPTPEKKSK
ncbi:MAG: hypothetical protein IPM23_13020 [Candidatus Melainabacteria bacterium]|nr:hypothetical protein [Candidatus Melainabacteria bacterium]